MSGYTRVLGIRIDDEYYKYLKRKMSQYEYINFLNLVREIIYTLIDQHIASRIDLNNIVMNTQQNINLQLLINYIPINQDTKPEISLNQETVKAQINTYRRKIRELEETIKYQEEAIKKLEKENRDLKKKLEELENNRVYSQIAIDKVLPKLDSLINEIESDIYEIENGQKEPKIGHYKYYRDKLIEIRELLKPNQ